MTVDELQTILYRWSHKPFAWTATWDSESWAAWTAPAATWDPESAVWAVWSATWDPKNAAWAARVATWDPKNAAWAARVATWDPKIAASIRERVRIWLSRCLNKPSQ